MPVIFHGTDAESEYLIWRMEEDEAALAALLPAPIECPHTAAGRRREFYAVRCLLAAKGIDPARLAHRESGAPFLSEGPFLSLSHTRDYAAALFSETDAHIGIDIEMCSERFFRVESHYLHPSESQAIRRELPDGLPLERALGIWWCAKEALYKAAGQRVISFSDDFRLYGLNADITRSEDGADWTGRLRTAFNGIGYRIDWQVSGDFILALCHAE